MRVRGRWLACGAAGSILWVATGAAQQRDPVRADAARMQGKLVAIVERAEKPAARSSSPVRTVLTEQEVNAFFKVHGPSFVPEGLNEPQLNIDQGGRVRARAIVDLDLALKPKERSWLDPLAWVGGKMEVTAAGVLRAADGKGVFALETATLGGVPVPTTLVQELVSYYSRSPENPKGIALDQPFALPAKIKSVETRRGAATVLQ
jgi:hypothetical protein